ncbi:DUF397 domain-containing protein [Streptomyces sp. NPDC093510]|uniref:DUF397 domain-containing protein n=1 Tax=Streptomyces sp. NPDC093510 TaxID=3155199 RepID=UPI003430C81E
MISSIPSYRACEGTPTTPAWQKSSYCSEGDSCLHVSAPAEAIQLTESSDPTGATVRTTPPPSPPSCGTPSGRAGAEPAGGDVGVCAHGAPRRHRRFCPCAVAKG